MSKKNNPIKSNLNDQKIFRFKKMTLTIFLLILLCFSLFISVRNAFMGSLYSDPAYVGVTVLSLLFLILLLRGHYQLVSISSAYTFTLLLSIRFLLGPFRELNVIYFAIIIVAVLFLAKEWVAYSIILYSQSFLIVHFLLIKNTQDVQSDYLLFALLTLTLISLFCVLNMKVLSFYIKRISKHRDDLEEQVNIRTEDLRASIEYAELLFSHSPSAIYATDVNNNVVNFNRKAESVTGYSKEEIVGKNFNSLCKESFISGNENEYEITNKKGEIRIIERHSSHLHDKNGIVFGSIEILIDLTEWRELEEYKSDIERIIRHDLKTPLNSILGFPKMMIEDETISNENKEYLQIILNAGKNMKNLIESSQYLYKLEKGSFEFSMEEVDVFRIIKQIVIDLKDMIEKKKCPIPVLLNNQSADETTELKITTEKTLLYMILSNLIKNALEASPRNSEITVHIKSMEGLTVSVHNAGIIPMKIRNTFFNKYVTIDKKGGTGLGTYSAKLMSNAIGADLSFTSDEENGTVLLLCFPE